jgi:hypothetical protein
VTLVQCKKIITGDVGFHFSELIKIRLVNMQRFCKSTMCATRGEHLSDESGEEMARRVYPPSVIGRLIDAAPVPQTMNPFRETLNTAYNGRSLC